VPLWRPFTDIITNVRAVIIDDNIGAIASSYDRRISILSHDASKLHTLKLPEPIELDSLVTLPSTMRDIRRIRHIFVGGARKGGVIYSLSTSILQIINEEKISQQSFGGITFIKAFNIGEIEIITAGAPEAFWMAFYKDGKIVEKFKINCEGSPIEATLHPEHTTILFALAEMHSKKISIYLLNNSTSKKNVEIKHQFRIKENPAFIRFISLEDNTEEPYLLIGDRSGRISLRKLNGEKVWSQFLGEPLAWRRVLIEDINDDGEIEIIVGCQTGVEDLSKKSLSPLFILNWNSEILSKATVKGWIKDFRIIDQDDKKLLLVAAGKRIYLFALGDNLLKEERVIKFEKAIWSIDLLEVNEALYLILGFADGEIGFARIEEKNVII